MEISEYNNLTYGLEYKIFDQFFFRVGDERTLGLGFKTDALDFNFAYIQQLPFNTLTQYSLVIKLEGFKKLYKELGI